MATYRCAPDGWPARDRDSGAAMLLQLLLAAPLPSVPARESRGGGPAPPLCHAPLPMPPPPPPVLMLASRPGGGGRDSGSAPPTRPSPAPRRGPVPDAALLPVSKPL